ncbi:MAG: hypothetical protein AAF561_15010 [Planctomycetota bacterium]
MTLSKLNRLLVMVGFLGFLTLPTKAEPSTRPADLLRLVPPVSTSDPDIKSLSIAGRMPFSGVSTRFDLVFKRETIGKASEFSLVVRDAQGVPLLVAMNGWTYVYDAVNGVVRGHESGLCNLKLRSSGDGLEGGVTVESIGRDGETGGRQTMLVDVDVRGVHYVTAMKVRASSMVTESRFERIEVVPNDSTFLLRTVSDSNAEISTVTLIEPDAVTPLVGFGVTTGPSDSPLAGENLTEAQGWEGYQLAIWRLDVNEDVPDAAIGRLDRALLEAAVEVDDFDRPLPEMALGAIMLSREGIERPDLRPRLERSFRRRIDWDEVIERDAEVAPKWKALVDDALSTDASE